VLEGVAAMAGLVSAFLGSRLKLTIAAPTKPAASAPRQVTSMAKKKGIRCIVTLECTEARTEGGTPSRYVTQKVGACAVHWLTRMAASPHWCTRAACTHVSTSCRTPIASTHADYCSCGAQNRKNTSARLELRKYNKFLRRITLHREIK